MNMSKTNIFLYSNDEKSLESLSADDEEFFFHVGNNNNKNK